MARPRGVCRDLVGEPRRRLLAELARAYTSGATITALAVRHHRGRGSITALLDEAGVPLRRDRSPAIRGRARRVLADELRRRYEADRSLTIAALAETVPHTYVVVRALLREAGTTIRPGARHRRNAAHTPCASHTGEPRHHLLAELTRAYEAGATLTALAAQHHHTTDTIKARLREAGTPLRQDTAPAIKGEARRALGRELRRRYEADPTLTIAALATTVPYSYAAVRNMLFHAGTTIRPSRTAHLGPAHQHGMRDAAFHGLGLALRHLHLTGTADTDTLARFTGHTVRAINDALHAVEVNAPLIQPRTPNCPIPDDEALALGTLLWPRYRIGISIHDLAGPLGTDALSVITHALRTYATTHLETPTSDDSV